VFVTAETQMEGLKHEYAFATRNGWQYDGAPVVVRFDPVTAAERGASIELAAGWRDFRAGTVIDCAAPCVSAPPDFLSESGIFDLRGAGRHEHAANRAAVRSVVTAYDTRGPVATEYEDGLVTGFGIRGGVPEEAMRNEEVGMRNEGNDEAAMAALEAEERLMAYA